MRATQGHVRTGARAEGGRDSEAVAPDQRLASFDRGVAGAGQPVNGKERDVRPDLQSAALRRSPDRRSDVLLTARQPDAAAGSQLVVQGGVAEIGLPQARSLGRRQPHPIKRQRLAGNTSKAFQEQQGGGLLEPSREATTPSATRQNCSTSLRCSLPRASTEENKL